MNQEEAIRAYKSQPEFNRTVEMLYHLLRGGMISVYELRDACTLAINKFAAHQMPEMMVVPKGYSAIDYAKMVWNKERDETDIPCSSPDIETALKEMCIKVQMADHGETDIPGDTPDKAPDVEED